MLKIVLDTNVLVSALLKADTPPELIVSLIGQSLVTLCVSKPIVAEYREVLSRRKFRKLDRAKVKKLLSRLESRAQWVTPRVPVEIIETDPEDNKFLECALESEADFLITGNTRHFPFEKFHHTRIVSPGEFIHFVARILLG
ncbi:MAG TPA: putative toxin-antitoxin system toxin component, PIN family [Syntrophobacter fumaroxidans]|nr:putative toxin-antitoxin system toxin component, PIN family [Syntrophobacter fumaroxidans]